jgi:hypothetical protein
LRPSAPRLSFLLLGLAAVLVLPVARSLEAQGTSVLTREFQGLTGHVGVSVNGGGAEPGFEYGLSYYSTVSPLNAVPAASTQLGWGTWLIPNNQTFTQPLCPVGTFARDNWPERGPSYRDVYQTIEGGMGQWGSTRFPSPHPKFRVNSTPDCYTTQVSSSAWTFGGTVLPPHKLGLAQLSNRLLLTPDGITLDALGGPSVLGNGWLALPLIPSYTPSSGAPTGDQSWTLFLHAANFTGPVAFFTPEIWSAINASDATGTGRGHDAMRALTGSVALEIGITPMFTSAGTSGVRYRRIPRLTFHADANREAILVRDVRYYSKQAIWDAATLWLQNGLVPAGFDARGTFAPPLAAPRTNLTLGGAPVTMDGAFGSVASQTAGGAAFGLEWKGGLEPGVIPEYFREAGGRWLPVPASEVPHDTWLADQQFPAPVRRAFPALDQSTASPWVPTRYVAGPFTVSLSDSSVVQYVWYRFVDQPAIARLGLSEDVRQRLQTFAVSLHTHSGLAGVSFAPPSSGTLATLDAAQLVSPPPGLEVGYVPVVVAQR